MWQMSDHDDRSEGTCHRVHRTGCLRATRIAGGGYAGDVKVVKTHLLSQTRSAPFESEPGYYEPARLWLYGNVRLLGAQLAAVQMDPDQLSLTPAQMDGIERQAERLVLDGHALVTGIHNGAHQRAAVVPLRWGAPRVLVLSGGFYHHLGKDLKEEPFRTARLWRYQFDAHIDPVISRRHQIDYRRMLFITRRSIASFRRSLTVRCRAASLAIPSSNPRPSLRRGLSISGLCSALCSRFNVNRESCIVEGCGAWFLVSSSYFLRRALGDSIAAPVRRHAQHFRDLHA